MRATQEGEEKLEGWHLVLTMLVAIGMAVLLFVVAPHALFEQALNGALESTHVLG